MKIVKTISLAPVTILLTVSAFICACVVSLCKTIGIMPKHSQE